jgi:tetratricopeptide (TPR) repeat protein/tRNA A-37 threonylcarbamoyl transferase component Bud32
MASPDEDPLVGTVLARKFRIHAVLGEGGMGRVYRAEQLPLGVDVVVKTLHAKLVTDRIVVARFFREAQAASRLRHPNSVSILDFGDADGTLYIAMEYLRGRALSRVLVEDGRFEPRRAIRIANQVLDVLAAAHHSDIVHRDLKPDNIMVEDLPTQSDFVKVLDFGIAKIASSDEKLTQAGMVFGTPSYMSPEQAGGSVEIDGRADLYSVGVILYELLTGRVPLRADSLPMLLVAVATEPAPPVRSLRADVPPALADIIDMTLAKDPASRPQTALEMKAALEAVELAPRRHDHVRELPVAQIACSRCGKLTAAASRYCGECGTQLAPTPPGGLTDKLADLRRYLPTGIVDEIAQLRTRDAGEKREVVALVVDITGPAEPELLAELDADLAELALRQTGTIEHRPGSGVVIVFGASVSHGDDAERAVETALDARRLVRTLNTRHELALEVSCALHAGSVIVDPKARSAYSPVGDTIELPMRLAAAVANGKIVVTDPIQRAIRTLVDLRPMHAVRLKGHAAGIQVHEVTSTAVIPRGSGGLLATPPFAGRDDGLAAITAAVDVAPHGQTIHVAGEPGIGKTRLLAEVARALTAAQRWVVAVSARSGGLQRIVEAFGGVDALRALGLEPIEIRAFALYLGDQVGDAQLRDTAIASNVHTALELLGARAPVCVVIDDVHLAEPRMAAVIHRLVTDPAPHVTVVTAARSGYPLPWPSTAAVRTATLAPLDTTAIEAIVAGAIAPTPAPRDLLDAVSVRAAGSPLIALEVMREMIDTGVLASVGGRWTTTGSLANVPKPASLRALYGARLDALPAYARDVLAGVAVIGSDEVSLDVLDRVIAIPQGAPIDRELRLLVNRGLIATTAARRVRFVEASAREAAYDRIPRDTRKQLHHAVALALEAEPAGCTPETIGEHHELGGDPTRALDWLARGTEAALAAHELKRACTILQRARAIARATPSATTNRRFVEDSLRLATTLLDLGELSEVKAVVAEGLAAAHKQDEPLLIAKTRRVRGRAAMLAGDLDVAATDLESALAAAVGQRERTMIAELHGDLGELHERRGDLAKAKDTLVRALELVQSSPDDARQIVLRLLAALGRVVLRDRDPDRAERFLQQALDLAEALADKHATAKVLGNVAAVWHARADYRKALEFARRALDMSRELGDLVGTARQLTNIGTLCALAGDDAGARRSYDAAYVQAQRACWREGMASAAAARDQLNRARTPAR